MGLSFRKKKPIAIILLLALILILSTVKAYGQDMSQLSAAIAAAESRNPANYTALSWSRVNALLNPARGIRDNPSPAINQQAINNITNDLFVAVALLVPIGTGEYWLSTLDTEILAALESISIKLDILNVLFAETSYNQASANFWIMFLLAALTGLSVATIFTIVWGNQ